jgi:ABC-type antimicrobial peptide transport system permease subunit
MSDGIYNALGIDSPLTVKMTTFQTMQQTETMQVFLDQLFTSTLIVMVALGALLIYTLMLSDIEEKTYEYGISDYWY